MLNNVKKYLVFLKNVPKTIFFNFKYFGFRRGIHLPVFVSHNVLLSEMKGNVEIKGPIRTGMIKIGFRSVGIFDPGKSRSIWQIKGTVQFNGPAIIGQGCKISIGPNGQLILGKNFIVSAETEFISYKKIEFGNDCLLSWRITVMDTDFHKIKTLDGVLINEDREITFGDKTWIGCNCLILKGTKVGNNCVIAANSFLNREIEGENQIIGGNPPQVLKTGITWEM